MTSHSREEMELCKPDFLVEDLSQYALFCFISFQLLTIGLSISFRIVEDGVEVTINTA